MFKLELDRGRYRIRFQLAGQRKTFYPGCSDELDARILLRQMERDYAAGKFDVSLQSYKLKAPDQIPQPVTVIPQPLQRLMLAQQPTKTTAAHPLPVEKPKLIELWDRWVEWLNPPLHTLNNHYHCVRRMIEKADPDWDETGWFVEVELAPSTWGTRWSFIKGCIAWSIDEELIGGKNPWIRLRGRKGTIFEPNPFNQQEVRLILEAFQSDRFRSKYAPVPHSFYLDFVKFLLLTAMRPGEAIALRWADLNFERGEILVAQAMGRDLANGPSVCRKIRKSTKTNETRILPMSKSVRKLLLDQRSANADSGDLVFRGARGGVLDIRSFREVWIKVLAGLDIEYRNPYQLRHTSLSMIAQDHGLAAAAKVAGHKSLDMVSRHYVRFLGDLRDVLPEL